MAFLPCRPRPRTAFLPKVGTRAFLPRLVFFRARPSCRSLVRVVYRVLTHTSALLASASGLLVLLAEVRLRPAFLPRSACLCSLHSSSLSSESSLPSAHLAVDLSLHDLLVVQTALFLAYLPREGAPRASLPRGEVVFVARPFCPSPFLRATHRAPLYSLALLASTFDGTACSSPLHLL